MKRMGFLTIGLLGLSLIGLGNGINFPLVSADEEEVAPHERVIEPTRALMNEIANHMENILDGILAGNFKYVAQEAGAVVNQSYKINETFFLVDPKENPWYKRANIDPSDSKKITKLKEDFDVYLKNIASSALEIQKAAKSNDEGATLKSFTTMIEKTCFECHKNLRNKQIPIENR
ncbi:MAG: hypothetical protein JETT_1475 [Candidatus Jettenia ecosi]|uniref:Cytochrome c n=1 Tax=Candidatus Jettenia ecosi TaxID=2494326 RepID=A0A533QC37_9BACT|nr:MAG: hypothetical protein JETT_1475 [Candidatus Jettenia ecosi]